MGTIVLFLLALAVVWAARSSKLPLLALWALALAAVLIALELRSDRA